MALNEKVFKRAGIGFLIALAICSVMWICGAQSGIAFDSMHIVHIESRPGEILFQALVGGLYGAVAMGSTVIYEIEHWSLAVSSAVHYFIIAVLYVPIALVLGWVKNPVELFLTELIQLVVYFIIWFIMVLRYRAQVRKMNESLKRIVRE